MGKTKRIISMAIIVMMMVTMLPLQAFAEEIFTVDYNLTNVTVNGGVSTVTSGTAINISITAEDGYELPDSITVNGVYDELNYDKGTGNIEVTNIQSNIEIVAEGTKIPVSTTVSYTVSYLEVGSNKVLAEPKVVTGQTVGTLVKEYPVEIGGYEPETVWIGGDSIPKSASIVLTEEENTIIFLYSEAVAETGTVVIRYEDENGNELLSEEANVGLEIGEHTFNAPIIEGYTADFNSETVNLEYDGQIRYVVFTYTAEQIIEEPVVNDFTTLNVIGISCLNENSIVIDECDILFENTETFNGGTFVDIPLMIDELQFKKMYEEDWDFDLDDYFEIGRTGDTVEFIVESSETKELTLYAVYSTPKAPQIKIVYADCSDLDYKSTEDLEEFGRRNSYDNHNVLNEEYYNLEVGENIINIPSIYNELEWTLTGHDFLDSEFNYEFVENEQGNKEGINLTAPYLIDLTLYVGYTLPEVEEEPEQEVSRPSVGGGNSAPKVEEAPISIKNIQQEDFVSRYLLHKIISEEFKKFSKNNVEFEVDKTLLNELLGDDLIPRLYRWSVQKQKLIAESTKFTVKQGTDNIYTLTTERNVKDNYYILVAVQQPEFKDVKEFDYYIDKANGLGLIEGIETDGVLNFEAEKQITKSEYYTMIARIFGSMPLGETKLYDILSLKSVEEAEQVLEGLELEVADWSKPYVASLYEKGYITVEDLIENGNQITMESAMRTLNKVLSEVEGTDNLVEDMNFEQDEFCTRYKMAEILVSELVKKGW